MEGLRFKVVEEEFREVRRFRREELKIFLSQTIFLYSTSLASHETSRFGGTLVQ